MNQQTPEQPRKPRSLTPLWVLIALTLVPYVAGWLYFSHRDAVPIGAASNRGDLVSPVRPLGSLPLQTLDAGPASTSELQGKWTLVTVAPSTCPEDCQRNLYFMRQVRRAMADKRFRVERLLIVTDTADLQGLRAKLAQHEGLHVAVGPPETLERLREVLRVNDLADPSGARFIVDPLGNLMMSYAPDSDPEDMAEDLRRLLELSRIG